MGLFTRLTKVSADAALRMQPKRTARVRDDILYASPAERDTVKEIRDAGERLVAGGLTPATLGAVAVTRTDATKTRTIPGADLRRIDNRMLELVNEDDSHPVVAALRSAGAAVWAHPPHLLALRDASGLADHGELSASVGAIAFDPPTPGSGVSVFAGRGVIATGADPSDAVTLLETAELLAKIGYYEGGTNG